MDIFKYILQQAEAGDTAAQIHLANLYLNGYDVQQNTDEALKWYQEAARHGDIGAQASLGALYYNGDHLKQNYKEAMKWFRMAAERDDANVQADVGSMFENGQGVPQDNVEAYFWYSLAGRIDLFPLESKTRIAARLTAQQKAAVDQRVTQWKPLPARPSAIYKPQLLTCAEYKQEKDSTKLKALDIRSDYDRLQVSEGEPAAVAPGEELPSGTHVGQPRILVPDVRRERTQ
jgi:hypothetical protein